MRLLYSQMIALPLTLVTWGSVLGHVADRTRAFRVGLYRKPNHPTSPFLEPDSGRNPAKIRKSIGPDGRSLSLIDIPNSYSRMGKFISD
jgi:hypothetical protein